MQQLPDWLEPLPDRDQIREIDRWAIEDQEIPSLTLMERAGAGLAEIVDKLQPQGRIVVVCGKGNNGGDGLVAARLLRERSREVDVAFFQAPAELRGDAKVNLERLPGNSPIAFSSRLLNGATVIVDALLGTGFTGSVRDPMSEVIEAINASGVPVIAVDIPSGVDASTGAVTGTAIRATATATFHAAKPGLWINPGKQHSGEVNVVDIGIPDGAPVKIGIGLIRASVLMNIPHRLSGSTKFDSGNVVVVGGSTGLTGAPSMVALAAMRTGAGYVTACVPKSLNVIFEQRLLEAMTVGLDDSEGSLLPEATPDVLAVCKQRQGSLVLGPGIGRKSAAFAFVRELAKRAEVPLVLDADGLNAHAGSLGDLTGRQALTVLTPHAGELARLLKVDSAEVNAQRLQLARNAAEKSNAVVVLKGDDTLVVSPEGMVAISPGGSPALATAGTGDVLSGVLGALLAKNIPVFEAASAGVYAHCLAGRLAADHLGTADCVIASDVIEQLPAALAKATTLTA